MTKTNIRLEVDPSIYELLKEQQQNYYIARKRKISIANVVLHYFNEGYVNANIRNENGLFIIQLEEIIRENSNNFQRDLKGNSINIEEPLLNLRQRELRIKEIEKDLSQREHELLLKESDLTRGRIEIQQSYDAISQHENQELINSRVEIAKIKMELEFIKKDLKPDHKVGGELRKISRQLNIIENQTKKTTMDVILQFAGPLISMIGFFVIDKKLKTSNPEIEGIHKEIKNIYSKLNDDQRELISEQLNFDLDGML